MTPVTRSALYAAQLTAPPVMLAGMFASCTGACNVTSMAWAGAANTMSCSVQKENITSCNLLSSLILYLLHIDRQKLFHDYGQLVRRNDSRLAGGRQKF